MDVESGPTDESPKSPVSDEVGDAASERKDRTGRNPGRGWRRRWLRRIGVFVAVAVFGLTGLSACYNLLTDQRMSVPAGLTYVQTGDISTRYREWGSGGSGDGSASGTSGGASGTPIVLVHGFVESADTWQSVASRLAAAGYRVYALDLDGWGYTQRVAPFDLSHQTAQLLGFIAALHLDRPILVGHSSGAAIVADAALRSPSAVGGIMFLDGDGLATGAGQRTPFTRLLISPYRTTLLRLLVRSDAVVRAIYGEACGPTCPRLDAAGVDQWRRPLQVPGAETSLWGMVNLGVAGLPPQTLAGLASLPVPKSVVFGGDDSAYDATAPQQTAARIGAPTPIVIAGARHLTPVNSPAVVAAAIEALVRAARE